MAVLQSEFFDLTGTYTEVATLAAGVATVSASAQITLKAFAEFDIDSTFKVIEPPGANFYVICTVSAAPTLFKKALSTFISIDSWAQLANIGETNFFGGGVQTESICLEDQLTSVVPVPFELRLRTAFPASVPTLERYRRLLLTKVCTSNDIRAQSRALVGFTRTTDLKAMFLSLLGLPYDQASYAICSKRKAIDVDRDIQILANTFSDALSEMLSLGTPPPHLELLGTRLVSSTFNNRVSAVCSMVYLAAILIAESE